MLECSPTTGIEPLWQSVRSWELNWPLFVSLQDVKFQFAVRDWIPTSFLFLPSSSLDFFLDGLFESSPPLAWSISALKLSFPPKKKKRLLCDPLLLKSWLTPPATSQSVQVMSSQKPFRVKIMSRWSSNSPPVVSSSRGGCLKKERCGRMWYPSWCLLGLGARQFTPRRVPEMIIT